MTDNGSSSYGLDFTDFLTMDCTLSGDMLECEGNSEYDGLGLTFSR